MSLLKDQAEALVECLRLGIVDRSDVVAWADKWLEAVDAPEVSVCELAVSRGKTDHQVIDLLHDVRGTSNPESRQSLVFASIRTARESGRVGGEWVAGTLCRMGVHLVEDGATRIWSGCFEDELDCENAYAEAVRRHHGRSSRQDVLDAMTRVLHHLSKNANWGTSSAS